MEKYTIPQHLDAPFKLILWTMDEVICFCIPFLLLLMFFNAPLTGFLLGTGLIAALKKLKGEEGQHFIMHLIYWYLPPVVHYKATPPSYQREIIG